MDDYSTKSEIDSSAHTLTKEPFGSTEKQVSHEKHLSDVEFLDLNRPAPNDPLHAVEPPPNPLATRDQDTTLPVRDEKLSQVDLSKPTSSSQTPQEASDEGLPEVKAGEGDGPRIVYGSDIVLDAAGYHNGPASPGPSSGRTTPQARPRSALVDAFTQDLITATGRARPTLSHNALTDPPLPIVSTPLDLDEHSFDLPESSSPSRFDRGRSEPPMDFYPRRPISGTISTIPNAAMDHAWDWGRLPDKNSQDEYEHGDHGVDHVRADSMSAGLDLAVAKAGHPFGHVEENPYLFTFSGPSGKPHAFELSTCGELSGENLSVRFSPHL